MGPLKIQAATSTCILLVGLNYLIGNLLANTGYVLDRDMEFTRKDVSRKDLIAQLEDLIPMVSETVTAQDMEAKFPSSLINAGFLRRPSDLTILPLSSSSRYFLFPAKVALIFGMVRSMLVNY